ncbi:MAG: hypothetical protein PHU81_05065 [Acidobacteriota bacterium]|nr:hypothetical protein [Acidobacteriota bacterium]
MKFAHFHFDLLYQNFPINYKKTLPAWQLTVPGQLISFIMNKLATGERIFAAYTLFSEEPEAVIVFYQLIQKLFPG